MGKSLFTCGLVLAAVVLLAAVDAAAESAAETLKKDLGITSIKKGALLKIRLTPQARCFFGDMDVIYRDSGRLPEGGRILVTLEPIASAGGSPAIAMHELYGKEGVSSDVRFQLPADLPAGAYGVFICSDISGQAKSCAKANAMPFDQLLAPYEVAVSKDRTEVASPAQDAGLITQDRVYFFRSLLVTEDAILYAAKAGQKKLDSGFGDYVKAISAPGAVPTDEGLGRMNYLDTAITSIPFVAEGDVLNAVLPYYSPVKCGASNPQE